MASGTSAWMTELLRITEMISKPMLTAEIPFGDPERYGLVLQGCVKWSVYLATCSMLRYKVVDVDAT